MFHSRLYLTLNSSFCVCVCLLSVFTLFMLFSVTMLFIFLTLYTIDAIVLFPSRLNSYFFRRSGVCVCALLVSLSYNNHTHIKMRLMSIYLSVIGCER